MTEEAGTGQLREAFKLLRNSAKNERISMFKLKQLEHIVKYNESYSILLFWCLEKSYPANIYMFQVTIKTLIKDAKYVQS